MTLFTQSIYNPLFDLTSIIGISVMSRHTLNDGVTPLQVPHHLWLQDLAPPDRLVGAWYRRKVSQPEFTTAYLAHLQQPAQISTLKLLIELALISQRKPTLLCVEPPDQFCHRRLLAQACVDLEPRLQVVHL